MWLFGVIMQNNFAKYKRMCVGYLVEGKQYGTEALTALSCGLLTLKVVSGALISLFETSKQVIEGEEKGCKEGVGSNV